MPYRSNEGGNLLYEQDEDFEWNDGYITEGLQTCHIVMSIMDSELSEHPAVIRAGKKKELDEAIDAVMSIYQAIGGLDHDFC